MRDQAAEELQLTNEGLKKWFQLIRPDEGPLGRFKPCVKTTRAPNILTTKNALSTDIMKASLTDREKREGIEWVKSLYAGDGKYVDPVITCRRPIDYPAELPYPAPGTQELINRFSVTIRGVYGDRSVSQPKNPNDAWPGVNETERLLPWIDALPWEKDAWQAGSHAMRICAYLLDWCKAGEADWEVLYEVVRHVYSLQDPESGLWGSPESPVNVRINGYFKLSLLFQGQLGLPCLYPEKIIDAALGEYYRPDYEESAGGCDEYDNWVAIMYAGWSAPDYRREEISALAAYRICEILRAHRKPDGGLSFFNDHCATHINEVDISDPLPQGDIMGAMMISASIGVAAGAVEGVEKLGITYTDWKHGCRELEDPRLREKLYDGVGIFGRRPAN